MPQSNYWFKFTQARQTRRQWLTATGGAAAGLAALSLVGCGDNNKASSGSKSASSLLYTPVDTSAKAMQGGAYDIFQQADISAFNSGNGGDAANSQNTYSRIVRYDAYKYPDKALPTTSPDAAVSWEASPDGRTKSGPTSSSTRGPPQAAVR
jgi:ABC-type oligopeptide transport system substrate-binding subunit